MRSGRARDGPKVPTSAIGNRPAANWQNVNASIPPARQLLPVAIASDPPGARIEVENVFAGKTPATIKLQPGEYRVTLTLAGHEPWNEKIQVEAGNPAALAAALKPFAR